MTRTVRATALLSLVLAAQAVAQTPAATPAPTPTPAAQAPAPAPAPAPMVKLDYDSLAFARQANAWFLAGEVDSLWAHTAPEMKENMKTKDEWVNMYMQLTSRAGSEVSVVEERWVKRNNARQYWRIFNATDFTEEPVVLRWALAPGKMIIGLGMNPLSRVPPVDPN
jgi:hypothetical protein